MFLLWRAAGRGAGRRLGVQGIPPRLAPGFDRGGHPPASRSRSRLQCHGDPVNGVQHRISKTEKSSEVELQSTQKVPLASIGGVTLPQAEAVAGYSAMVTLSMASNIGPRKYVFG
jgi:hypothetical protein